MLENKEPVRRLAKKTQIIGRLKEVIGGGVVVL
jgi:hypothetical protein